eukprot:scaffold320126_cov21-Tisochrysis_lutea.AAC.1
MRDSSSREVPENISQTNPDWVFSNGRPTHLSPTKIPPRGKDTHFVGFKFCPGTKPVFHSRSATAQYANNLTRLKTLSLKNPNRNNK